MFNFKKKIDLRMINPTSKMALKMQCLQACKGSVTEAEKLYTFLSDGIETIPDFDVKEPGILEQIQGSAGKFFNFVKENRSDIMQAWEYVRSMRTSTQNTETEQQLPEIPLNNGTTTTVQN
jgi:hypothetical protein